MKPPRANAYRDRWAGQVRKDDVGSELRVAGWVHRRRDHGGLIFIDLRDRTGLLQVVFRPEEAPDAHKQAGRLRSEDVISVRGRASRARGERRQPRPADRGGRAGRARDRSARGRGHAAVRGRGGRPGGERGAAAQVPLPGPPPRAHAPELRASARRDHRHTRLPERAGLPGGRDAGDDPLDARGRTRLPRAEPVPARLVVRAAAVAAALQADPDDRRLRALLPDRALLPGRGPARGPPARVHPARHGALVRRGGGRDHARRRHDRRGLRCGRRRGEDAARAARVRRRDAALRHRPARTAGSAWRSPTSPRRSRAPSSRSSAARSSPAASCAASRRAATSRASASTT